jgi:hypothetical protein
MTTSNVRLNYAVNPVRPSSLAIFFFLIGAPHIYIALQQRRQQQLQLWQQLWRPQNVGLISLTIAGVVALYACQ